jgi:hypothetical protein
VFLPQSERFIFALIQCNWQDSSSAFLIFIFNVVFVAIIIIIIIMV